MQFYSFLPPARSRKFKIRGAGILVTLGHQICLQRRTQCAPSKPGVLAYWGGEVEPGESMFEGARRELREELGIKVRRRQLLLLGAHSYELQGGRSLAARLLLQLPENTKLDCQEGTMEFYDNVKMALSAEKLDPHGTTWSLREAARLGLLPS